MAHKANLSPCKSMFPFKEIGFPAKIQHSHGTSWALEQVIVWLFPESQTISLSFLANLSEA
jgi:hypothetical protein